ncbi:cytochrome P450 6B6-like isoform X2 [Trichoplusia ni]|uniref:unspecific monooxygenase n=1 Tax=Trichoplusia ni TaxID=7111 RepID=A0A7E5WIS8_TRINI|nr:cytochrome P450 6B6-like isoform X2 [Trichoplusia ni]
MIGTLLTITLFILAYSLYLFTRRKFTYWKKKNIPHVPPTTIFGNYSKVLLLQQTFGDNTRKLCETFPEAPLIGAYYGTEPSLIVQDPELIKLVTTRDFYYFSGREISNHAEDEPLLRNLFSSYGDKWKALRQFLSPIFSSSKMKSMFPLIVKCSLQFEDMLEREFETSSVLDMKSIMSRFTMDCISSCSFGIETLTMVKTENNIFRTLGDLMSAPSAVLAMKNLIRTIWPSIFYGLGFKVFPTKLEDFFKKLLIDVFESRNYEPTSRSDFIDFLLKLKKNNLVGDGFKNSESSAGSKFNLEVDDEFLIAQCALFFGAGYESSSITLSWTLFELAKNPEKQAKAIQEVDAYLHRHDNKLEYECVAETSYLQACVDEAMRLYPVAGVLHREVTEDYVFPSGLKIEKGLRVHLPLYKLHYNPEYFPEPKKYRPERFYGDEKRNIKSFTYMPFGEGPRICIGDSGF